MEIQALRIQEQHAVEPSVGNRQDAILDHCHSTRLLKLPMRSAFPLLQMASVAQAELVKRRSSRAAHENPISKHGEAGRMKGIRGRTQLRALLAVVIRAQQLYIAGPECHHELAARAEADLAGLAASHLALVKLGGEVGIPNLKRAEKVRHRKPSARVECQSVRILVACQDVPRRLLHEDHHAAIHDAQLHQCQCGAGCPAQGLAIEKQAESTLANGA
mmetsp:Transcript_29437/g.60641  ORF Transcript_29437/g.60641 Transcript_29437/m.60641 type:complete len:218 (+) Transcript_29437:345-998(+)